MPFAFCARLTSLLAPPAKSVWASLSLCSSPVVRSRLSYQAVGVLLGASLLVSGCGRQGSSSPAAAAQPAPQVGVITLATQRHVVTTELAGRTSAFLSAEIRPQVGGIVQKRLFTEGAQVAAGQVLYQLDAAVYEVALATAQAQLTKARNNLVSAQTLATRNAELLQHNAVSRQVHDDSQTAVAQARADVALASAALEAARINLGYTRIKSPIAGRSATSSVTPGALVTANQAAALTTVTQIDPLYVDITQSSTEVLRLKADLAQGRFARSDGDTVPVRIVLDDGSVYPHPGQLAFSGVQVNPGTGAITLRAVLPNPEGLLMPGMYVRAQLEAGVNEQALLVPQQAVTRDPTGKPGVLLVTPDDQVQRRRIETGAAVGNQWEVLGGLSVGERVVVDGFQWVRPGDKVRPVPWAPQAAPSPSAPSSPAKSAS